MKIAIDISQIIYDTGVSVYTRELVKNLVALYPNEEYILFGGSLRRGEELKQFADSLKQKAVFNRISPTMADILWNKLHVLKIERLVGKVDIFHSSDWAEPPTNCPKVTTIHDLAPLLYPKLTDPRIVDTHRRRLYWVKNESSAVIVPSNATKEEVINLGVDGKKIKVIPEALRGDIKKVSIDEIEKIKKKYRISGEYAISIGNNPRKNTSKIISAFEKSKVEGKIEKLVVVGRVDGNTTSGVIFTGHVPSSDLSALYSGAELLLYPSVYEGFGLPILEAMKCETPVVTSNISSMPEAAGKAGVLVNPDSVESIAEGILKALKDKKNLIKLGLEQVERFSWQRTAKETMEVYRSLF